MDKTTMIDLYNHDQRKNIEYPDMRREVSSQVVRLVDTSGNGEGTIVFSDLHPSNADEIIAEQVGYFKQLRQDFEWKLYDYDQPVDLRDRLAAHGFDVQDPEAIMVLDLEKVPRSLLQPIPAAVRRITKPTQLAAVQSVEEQVWAEDVSPIIRYLEATLRNNPAAMSIYIAYAEGQPASAGWIYFPPRSQFASLWGGATIERFRKRGLFRALVAVRAQEALARKVRYLTVDASPMSRPILERLGFELLALSYPCKWKAESQPPTAGALPTESDPPR